MTIKPILYLAFNRPAETAITFAAIRKQKPKKLYVAVDGARHSEDIDKCQEVIAIVKEVDWKCDVHYLIRKENLGCRWAVNEALDWFFSQEEMGIIIEDDIVVGSYALYFMSELLEYYANSKNVMFISACNLLNETLIDEDYFFSRYGGVWGWASWRRVWQLHDKQMKSWPLIKSSKSLFKVLPHDQAIYREKTGDLVHSGEIDTWDYPFTITRIIENGLAVVPKVNLVQNIGFNENATHTTERNTNLEIMKLHDLKIEPLNHPKKVIINQAYDDKLFALNKPKKEGTMSKVKRQMKRIFKY